MSQTNRVFVTGMSALTSTGATANETWAAVLAGESGIDEIKQWDLSSWACRLGGELKHYQPASMLPDRKLMKVISRQDVLGINAAMQAVEHSQLMTYRDSLNESPDLLTAFQDSSGVFVGSPGNKYMQQYDFLPLINKTDGNMQAFAEQLFSEVHPMWLLRILPNNVLAYTGITYGFKGVNHNITNHAVGGMQAIIEAYHAIQSGQAERVIVVAYDIGIEPQALFYYDKLGVLSSCHLKPFDKQHDGTILAEGASALVLESEASVNSRSATCYAEITGGAATTEAAGLFSIAEDGQSLAQLITNSLAQKQLDANDFGMVVAHGNGNPKSDISEAHAIQQVFGAHHIPVTSFKWSTGHTLCASGVLDTVLGIYALREKCVPGIANFHALASGCGELNASAATRTLAADKNHALIINRGFASMNTCLTIKACE